MPALISIHKCCSSALLNPCILRIHSALDLSHTCHLHNTFQYQLVVLLAPMRYLWAHISSILQKYKGEVPLTHFLKGYYKQHPKLGSRDRRAISDAVYAACRCLKSLPGSLPLEEKIYAALYLCNTLPKGLAANLPSWWHHAASSVEARRQHLAGAGIPVSLPEIFPYPVHYSAGIAREAWIESLLQQPALFLRTRKPQAFIAERLNAAGIPYQWHTGTCLALPKGTSVESILAPEDYWIMDASSQQTGSYFTPHKDELWWDCCSGAGGKSLLLRHLEPDLSLTVSDVRKSILQNLKSRFKQYGIPSPKARVIDVTDSGKTALALGLQLFDAIICDAPCTGSGTWARSPEGAFFFSHATLESYTSRQKQILTNAAAYLKPGGRIIYITCSVFQEENEAVVSHAAENTGLSIQSMQLINGVELLADCLFVAVLSKDL